MSRIKALVLSGGRGTNLRPLTYSWAKHLLPVANKPVLFHVLEKIGKLGIREVGMVISPETGEMIQRAAGDGSPWGLSISYILQPYPGGLAHGVQVARDYLGDSPFLLYLGDILLQRSPSPLLSRFEAGGEDAVVLLAPAADPQRCGIVELDGKGRAVSLEEKPRQPRSNLAIVGVYVLSPAVHQAIARLRPSARGELEMTDALQELVNQGYPVAGQLLEGWWQDTGSPDRLLRANCLALEEFPVGEIAGKLDAATSVTGKVGVGQGTLVERSQLKGPVSIGEGCRIRDAVVGPHASIGAGSTIERAAVEDSILLEGCTVQDLGVITHSLIGRKGHIQGNGQNSRPVRLLLGDEARVEL